MAVYFMHSFNFIHRDIKPENIIFDIEKTTENGLEIEKSWRAVLVDFGTAVKISETDLKEKKGTVAYMAPEILFMEEDGTYDKACDLWSVGVLTYFLLIGTLPFKGNDENEIILNIKKFKNSDDNNIFE